MYLLLSRVSLGTAVMLAIALRSSPVGAQPAPSTHGPDSETQRAEAEQLTNDAFAAEQRKDYAEAIKLYTRAHRLDPQPLQLFNIGQAHELAGDPVRAEKFYIRYLALEPDGEGAPIARNFLGSLPPSAQGAGDEKIETDQAMENERARNFMTGGLVLLSVGALIGAGSFGFSENHLKFSLGMGLGSGLVIGGLIMHDYGRKQRRATRAVAWSPVVGTGFAGVALAGTIP